MFQRLWYDLISGDPSWLIWRWATPIHIATTPHSYICSSFKWRLIRYIFNYSRLFYLVSSVRWLSNFGNVIVGLENFYGLRGTPTHICVRLYIVWHMEWWTLPFAIALPCIDLFLLRTTYTLHYILNFLVIMNSNIFHILQPKRKKNNRIYGFFYNAQNLFHIKNNLFSFNYLFL